MINLFFSYVLLIISGLLCLTSLVFADQTSTGKFKKTINELMPVDEPIRLRNTVGLYDISLPISDRVEVKSIYLHLEFTNSISLLKERSALSILINKKQIAQFPLNPINPETIADIKIPISLIKSGYNRLTFNANQHYTYKCEDPAAPELWTEIDTVRSYFLMETVPKSLPPKLSMIKTIFDPKNIKSNTFNLLLPQTDEVYARIALLVSQGVGLRLEYVQPFFDVQQPEAIKGNNQWKFHGLNQQRLKGRDNIYIATRKDLESIVNDETLKLITGPFLGVYPLDIDNTNFIILISGITLSDVEKAAIAFGTLSFPFPDTQTMIIQNQALPSLSTQMAKNIMFPNGSYKFSHLGFKTKTIKGSSPEVLYLDIFIPPWLFALEQDVVKFDLHLAYAAGMRKDSTLNVLLNGRFERSIWLKEDAGAIYQHYIVIIPLNSFRKGLNRLAFAANMLPSVTGECQLINSEGLIINIFDDSVITMPNVPTFVELPDLELMVKTGFPYNYKSDGAELAVVVPRNDLNSLSSACSVISKLIQMNGSLMPYMHCSFNPKEVSDKDLLFFSPLNDLVLEVAKDAPIALMSQVTSKVPYPIARKVDLAKESYRSFITQFYEYLKDIFIPKDIIYSNIVTFITQDSGLGDTLLVLQYESPFASNRTLTLFTAKNTDLLTKNVFDALSPTIWNNLKGAACVLNFNLSNANEIISCQETDKRYAIGQKIYSAPFYFSRHPWFWLVAVLILTMIVAFVCHRALLIYKKKKHSRLIEDE